MRVISMILGDEEIARVEEGVFKNIVEPACKWEGVSNNLFKTWYEDCFYGIENSSTFEERLELLRKQNYLCYSKPHIQLTIQIIED